MQAISNLSFSDRTTPPVKLNQLKKPTLRLGSTHPDVAELQRLLGRYVFPSVSSNVFDGLTDYAVRLFQYRMFLEEDGIVGPQTWITLYIGAPPNMPVLESGSRNPAVKLLQKVLSSAGFVTAVDGVFGPDTVRSLSQFQRHMGIKADAIVGPSTWHALSKTRLEDSTRTIKGFTLISDQKRHAGPITDLAVSNLRRMRDQDFSVATASTDTTVKLWTAYGLQYGLTYSGDLGSVSTVAFHPNRLEHISGTHGGTVRLSANLTESTKQTKHVFPARGGGVEALAIDPMGYYIATGTGDGAVRLFDFEGELLQELSPKTTSARISDIAISARNGQLAVADSRQGVTLWTHPLDPQDLGRQLPGISKANVVCFSSNGFRLATAYGKSLTIFGNQRHRLTSREYPAGITAIAFNISGRYLAVGCMDGKVYVQDMLRYSDEQPTVFELEGHEAAVSALRFQGGAANTFSLQPEDFLYSADRSGRLITWGIADNLSDIG
ncbi:MAG: peptidoglycan-binding protein [Cyanobacteria bacterium J06634_6]